MDFTEKQLDDIFLNSEPSFESLSAMKRCFDSLLKSHMYESELWKDFAADEQEIHSVICEFLLGNGKRLRPLLFYILYVSYEKNINHELSRKLMLSMELIHAFILIHDDIIDKSSHRRMKATIHQIFNEFILNDNSNYSTPVTGENIAMVAGDMLYAYAIDLVNDTELPNEILTKILKVMTKSAVFTAIGELKEIISTFRKIETFSDDDVLALYDLKTSYYTFFAPMQIAAVLAEKDSDIETLKSVSFLLGKSFQLANDISELKEFGKNLELRPKDFEEKKRTFVLLQAYFLASDEDKQWIDSFLKSESNGIDECIYLYNLIISSGALDKTVNLASNYKKMAFEQMQKLSLSESDINKIKLYMDLIIKIN